MNENSDFDGGGQSEEDVKDSPLRIDETDVSKDGEEKQRSPKPKKSKATLNYGIVAAILILGSVVVPVFIKDWDFAITPFSVGVTILGMTYYSWKRKRDCSDKGIIFYSHSQIMYLWPIWLGAFVISDIIGFLPGLSRPMGEESFALPGVTRFHLVLMGVVIFFTSVNLRGVWAAFFAVATSVACKMHDWQPQTTTAAACQCTVTARCPSSCDHAPLAAPLQRDFFEGHCSE